MVKKQAERVPPTWEVPDNIYEGPHQIDKLVAAMSEGRKPSALSRWAKHADPIGFARRGLEIAIREASTEHSNALRPIINDWDHVSKLSENADTAIKQLLSGLNRWDPQKSEDIYLALRTSKAFSGSPDEKEFQVRSAASILLESAEIIQKLSASSRAQAKSLSAQNVHDGDASFRAFSVRIGETWVHLTGRAPAASKEGGPFMRFLEAAWYDAGGLLVGGTPGSVTPFISGAKAAREAFDQLTVDRCIKTGALPW